MSDLTQYCPRCEAETGHTYITGRTCICSGCGDIRQCKGVRKVKAGIESRKAAAVASVNKAAAMPMEVPENPADLQEALYNKINGVTDAPGSPAEKTKGETKMKAKLTAENKADIIGRHEAGEKNSVLAADFKCSENAIWYTCKNAGKKAKKAKSPKANRPAGEPQGEQTGGFKASIQAMVDAAVDARLTDLDARIEATLAKLLK